MHLHLQALLIVTKMLHKKNNFFSCFTFYTFYTFLETCERENMWAIPPDQHKEKANGRGYDLKTLPVPLAMFN
jgi:hypothetical protein